MSSCKPIRPAKQAAEILLGVVLTLLLAGCTRLQTPPEPQSPSSTRWLTPVELERARSAAKFGDAGAAFRLFLHFSTALHEPKKGVYWLRQAIQLGRTNEEYTLGFELMVHPEFGSQGETLTWLTKAAETGDEMAFYPLGELYESDRVVRRDLPSARAWYERAALCEPEGVPGIRRVAMLYLNPEAGVDRAVAYAWLQIAAERSDPQWWLGKEVRAKMEELRKQMTEQELRAAAEKAKDLARQAKKQP